MINHYNKSKIKKAWNKFINEEILDDDLIRSEILSSWIRSKNYGVNWERVPVKVLSKQDLQQRIAARKTMVDISCTIMKTIFKAVKDSGFLVMLADEEGYVLKIIGNPTAHTQAKTQENVLIEGANRSEEYIGTNGIGVCLAKDIPIQVWADEHYYAPHRNWTCSAAPIHNLEGNLIGCLNLSGPSDKIHLHSLGMLISSVKAIEMQMQIQKSYNEVSLYNAQLNAILASIPYGTLLLDNNGIITQINGLALNILKLTSKDNVIGYDIDDVIRYNKNLINLKSIHSNVYDKELEITTKNSSIRCSISITQTQNTKGEQSGIVLTLKKSKYIHKLINQMTSSQAQFSFEDIIGTSNLMMQTKKLGKIASESNSTVLLLGESGTGKELFAQSIHNNSVRSNNPFIAINCGALPRNLIESELFGYESGAFTGAKKDGRPGKFELANGGTIFLDEIGDLPLDIQATLLRVLENREVTRLGGNKNIKIDVKVITATNKNLEELIDNKMFRDDLFYRINVLSINIPPLRQRKDDIKHLADHFLIKHKDKLNKDIAKFDSKVYTIFLTYNWAGNVRELENVVERAVNIAEGNIITVQDLPPKLLEFSNQSNNNMDFTANTASQGISSNSTLLNLKEIELQTILHALEIYSGNVKNISEALGIGRRTIYRKFEEYDIDYASYRKN